MKGQPKANARSSARSKFAKAFEIMTYHGRKSETDCVDLYRNAGHLIRLALDAGLLTEHRDSLLVEYQYGLKKSEEEGWLQLWGRLRDILRLRNGLPLSRGSFSENCLLVAEEIKKDDQVSDNDKTDLPWPAKAIALAVAHLDWSATRIAEEIGINRTTLYKDKVVATALKARNQQKRPDKSHFPKGEKDSRTNNIEAW